MASIANSSFTLLSLQHTYILRWTTICNYRIFQALEIGYHGWRRQPLRSFQKWAQSARDGQRKSLPFRDRVHKRHGQEDLHHSPRGPRHLRTRWVREASIVLPSLLTRFDFWFILGFSVFRWLRWILSTTGGSPWAWRAARYLLFQNQHRLDKQHSESQEWF